MELEKFAQKNSIENSRFFARILVTGVILSITFFLLSIDSFRTYRSDILISVNVKSSNVVKNQDQLINNLVELPTTLLFYERLLRYNPDVRDVTAGFSPALKKQIWNEMISTSRVNENTSIIRISITTKHEADSRLLAIKSARTLFDVTAFYYNIKNEVDLRIEEGPTTSVHISGLFWLLLLSIICGFALSTLLSYFVVYPGKITSSKNSLIERGNLLKNNLLFEFKKKPGMPVEEEMESLKKLYASEEVEAPFVFKQEQEKGMQSQPGENFIETPELDPKYQEMKQLTKKIEPDKYPNFSEMPVREKRAENVPDNLPVAEESFHVEEQIFPEPLEDVEKDVEIPEQVSIEQTIPAITAETEKPENREPTAEELKERLNQLLRGEL